MCATSICQRRWPKRRSCGAVHLRAERRFVRARNYDAANELLNTLGPAGLTTFTYDNSGNRTQQETPSATTYYTWDTNSRLTSCEPPAGTVTMMYDTDGRRTQKQAPSAQSNYLYDFQRVLRESDGAGHTESEYTAAPVDAYGDLISEYEPATNTNSYHAYDGLGSTEMLLDDHALATDAYANRAFGLETHVSGGSATPYTFVGQKGYQLDSELDLYYVRERYFDYATGQWVSEDPLGYKSSDIHLYRYCFNNPVSVIDPSGRDCSWYDLVCQAREAAEWAAEQARRAQEWAAEQARRAAVLALNEGLKLANIDPDSFWKTLQNVGDVFWGIVNNAGTIADNLISGVKRGGENFFHNIGDHLKDWLFTWLFGGLHINKDLLPAQWNDWQVWIGFLADLVGLSWDKILGAVQAVFGQEIDLVLQMYDKLSGFVDKGWSGVAEWLQELGKELSDKLWSVGEIAGEVIDAVKTGLLKTAINLIIEWAGKLNPAGGLVAAVQAIYKVVSWVVDNWSKIKDLAQSVVDGVKALIDGSGVDKVASLVEKGLAHAFQAAADFILSFFGLDAVHKAIYKVAAKWADAVPRKIAELLGKLKGVLLEQLKKLWGGFWGRAEWTGEGEHHKVWVDFKQRKVLTSSSQEKSAAAYLKDLRDRTVKTGKTTAEVDKADEALKSAEESLESARTATATAAKKGIPKAERQSAVKAAGMAKSKAQSSLGMFAKHAGAAEKALQSSCSIGGKKDGAKGTCWRVNTLSRRGDGGERKIQDWRCGQRAATLSGWERGFAAPLRLVIDPDQWREVHLVQDREDGNVVEMILLRRLEWLTHYAVEEGTWVPVDLPEMGVRGEALVTAVHPCPKIEEGEGRVVTGTFRHSRGKVYELKVGGESEPLGVTGTHLVWSEDREDWVAVRELYIGEHLRSSDGGTPVVESLMACSEPEPVYNIEVEGDHCYRVGQQGLLVHNASVICTCDEAAIAASLKRDSAGTLHVYDMSINGGNFASKVNSIASANMQAQGKGVIYILKDETDTILKVGSTVLAEPTFSDRFYKYSAAVEWLKNEWAIQRTVTAYFIVCDVVASSTLRTIERDVRKHFTGLPWDNEGQRLGRRGKGVPGVTPARRDVNRMCVWVGEEWRRITDQELRDWVANNGMAAWERFAEHYGLERRHAKDAEQWYKTAMGRNFMGGGSSDPCITT
jgi:RHS repeat-associated protein